MVEPDALTSLTATFLGVIDGVEGQRLAQLVSGKPAQGWRRGGCLVLAEGVATWLGPERCQIMGLWRHGPPSHPEIVPHHVFVRAGDHFLDGNGILGRSAFEAIWARDGAVDFAVAHIAPYSPPAGGTIIAHDPAIAAILAWSLRVVIHPARALEAL